MVKRETHILDISPYLWVLGIKGGAWLVLVADVLEDGVALAEEETVVVHHRDLLLWVHLEIAII
jgi:hypothetical protein